MRGTEFAVAEIIWWMVASALLGLIIGWLLHRVFGGGKKYKELEAKYDAKKERYAELSSELGDWKTRASDLELDMQGKAEEITAAEGRVGELEGSLAGVRTELDSATAKAGALETNLADMSQELESATSRAAAMEEKIGESVDSGSRAAELEQQLAARTSELAELQAAHAAYEVNTEENRGKVAGLEAKVADLESQLAAAGAAAASQTSDLEALAAGEAEDTAIAPVADWADGETSLGTPGASHTDDLKVINGIGPKLEATLNEFGIKTWEQLATLSDVQVANVDAALEEFPGRITRDEWVSQAAELVTRFPDRGSRPDRSTFLNDSPD